MSHISSKQFLQDYKDDTVYDVYCEKCIILKSQKLNREIPYPRCIYPKDASQVIYEVYRTIGLPYVKFLYNGKPFQICTSGTASDCNLGAFVQETKSLVMGIPQQDFESFCKLGFRQAETHLIEPKGPFLISLPSTNIFSLLPIIVLVTIIKSAYQASRKNKLNRNSSSEISEVIEQKPIFISLGQDGEELSIKRLDSSSEDASTQS